MIFIDEDLPERIAGPLVQYTKLVPIVVATMEGKVVLISDRFFSGDESFFLGRPITDLVEVEPEPIRPVAPADINLVIDTGGVQLEGVTTEFATEGVRVHLIWPKIEHDSENSSNVYNPGPINRYAMFGFVNFISATLDQLNKDVAELQEMGSNRIDELEQKLHALERATGQDDTSTDDVDETHEFDFVPIVEG